MYAKTFSASNELVSNGGFACDVKLYHSGGCRTARGFGIFYNILYFDVWFRFWVGEDCYENIGEKGRKEVNAICIGDCVWADYATFGAVSREYELNDDYIDGGFRVTWLSLDQ